MLLRNGLQLVAQGASDFADSALTAMAEVADFVHVAEKTKLTEVALLKDLVVQRRQAHREWLHLGHAELIHLRAGAANVFHGSPPAWPDETIRPNSRSRCSSSS